MIRRRSTLLLLGGLAALALFTGACASTQSSAAGSGELAAVDHAAYRIAPVALTGTDGERYVLAEDTTTPLTLVFFGYTNCRTECPIVMSSLSSAMSRLDDADRKDVRVVFVTTDPDRDTTAVLRSYLDRYDPGFFGLTGKLDQIVKLSRSMHIYVGSGEKLPSGGYDLGIHDTHVSGVDETGRATVIWNMDTSPKQFADDIHTLLQKARS